MTEPASGTPESVVSEARALLAQHQPAEAARKLRLHLAGRTGTATDHMLLGVALAQSGEGLASLQAFEQAVALEPANAAAHFNLGQAYREFGRHREALAEMERALQLRPDYPAAAKAAGELRERLAPPPSSPSPPIAGGLPGMAAPTPPLQQPWVHMETEPVDERPLLARLMAAAWQLIASPGQAFNGGLDRFFNTPGAVGAVVNFFLLSVGLAAVAAWFSSASQDASIGAVIVVAAGGLNVLGTAAAIATFNRLTGGIGDFAGDFGSLALSFALIEATLSLLSLPLVALAGPVGASGVVTGLLWAVSFWKYCLEVALVMSSTEISLGTAIVLLAGARIVAQIATAIILVAVLAAFLGGPR